MRKLIDSLILIKIGQELGTDSPLARAIAEIIELALKTAP